MMMRQHMYNKASVAPRLIKRKICGAVFANRSSKAEEGFVTVKSSRGQPSCSTRAASQLCSGPALQPVVSVLERDRSPGLSLCGLLRHSSSSTSSLSSTSSSFSSSSSPSSSSSSSSTSSSSSLRHGASQSVVGCHVWALTSGGVWGGGGCVADGLTAVHTVQQQSRRSLTTASSMTGLQVSEEVRAALHAGKGVVALESTIITHGMPPPYNAQTALALEKVIRDQGATPATVGVIRGSLRVGLSSQEIVELADTSKPLLKISRRDLPYALAKGLSGGTTVSGTMLAAHAAGVPIFATGGIGGVHRGVEDTMDVSADLRELGRTPVAVVSAGVKSILDIPRTLEYLETEGVCVVTYGPTTDFPAFFVPRSGHMTPYSVQTPQEAANIIDASLRAALGSGMLFAVPIPEECAATGEAIDAAIQQAVEEARKSGVKGREVTPFILQRVNELTKGESLKANIALVKNNAKVAAQIAVALASKGDNPTEGAPTTSGSSAPGGVSASARKDPGVSASSSSSESSPSSLSSTTSMSSLVSSSLSSTTSMSSLASSSLSASAFSSLSSSSACSCSEGKPVVVGGAVVDFCAKVKETDIKMSGATYVGQIFQSFGGVGRNIADCMSRLGDPPLFISALGNDSHAKAFLSSCSHMELRGVRLIEGAATPTYCPVLTGEGHLMFGIGDMDLHSAVDPDMVSLYQEDITHAPLVCVDGNFSAAVIERVCQICAAANVPVWFEPTDVHKACKPLQSDAWTQLTYISPNLHECAAIWSSLTGHPPYTVTESSSVEEVVSVAVGYCRDLLTHIPVVMVTLGSHGLVLGCREEQEDKASSVDVRYYPSLPPGHPPPSIVNVSGAGDCLNAAMIHFITQGHDLDLSVKAGLMAAQSSLRSHNAVPASITPEQFTAEKVEEWAHFQATDARQVL